MRYTQTLLLAISLLWLMPGDVRAERGKLLADCIIQLKGVQGGPTRLTVMPGTMPAYVLTPSDLHFVLDLVLDETYLLTFEHPGCVTKQLYVDATVPLDKRTGDFNFPLKVLLEHHEKPFTYAGPVGFIFYEHGLTDFTYHTDYAININERFAERMSELERTGIDPRSAMVGYTASTTRALPVSVEPKDDIPMPQWGTLAPTVAHVAPMVHRLGKNESGARRPEEPRAPTLFLEPHAPAVPLLETRIPQAAPLTRGDVRTIDVPQVMDAASSVEPSGTRHADDPLNPVFSWELIVEERRLTTIIRFTDQNDRCTEYRRVLHSSGAAYYFQDGRSISENSYAQDTHILRDGTTTAESEACKLLQ